MESKKLEKKIRDWANNLSFKLSDGSPPPANYFALLTATPHRRQLWEALMESVQPRQKIELMRKQIAVAKLRDRKRISRKTISGVVTSRVELWYKQNELENQMKERKDEMMKLKSKIFAKASDVLFEICKLAELEKLYDEYSEKALAVRLFTKREKNMMSSLEKILSRTVGADGCGDFVSTGKEKSLECVKNELLNADGCKNALNHSDDCTLASKLRELSECGISEECIWEEVIKSKKTLLSNFSQFLEELNSVQRNLLSEKEIEIEKTLHGEIIQLKQKATEKSLQVILNSIEGQSLDWEIEKLTEALLEEPFTKESFSGTFNEVMSPIHPSDSLLQNEKTMKNLRRYAEMLGQKSYGTFLKEESKRLEGRIGRWGGFKESDKTDRTDVGATESFDCILEEINSKRSEEQKLAEEIRHRHENLLQTLECLNEEAEEKKKARAVEDVEKLKSSCGKLIDVFMETPSDAFRTVESSSGRQLFECESLPHCLNSYGGEFKQFFSAMLIPPLGNPQSVLSEVERRKKLLAEARNVIREREKLTDQQRKIQQLMGSIKLDSQLCGRNFKESDAILWKTLSKSDELLQGTDLIEKILKNWVEQPYRLMVEKLLVKLR